MGRWGEGMNTPVLHSLSPPLPFTPPPLPPPSPSPPLPFSPRLRVRAPLCRRIVVSPCRRLIHDVRLLPCFHSCLFISREFNPSPDGSPHSSDNARATRRNPVAQAQPVNDGDQACVSPFVGGPRQAAATARR